jgi:hypothetical protein
LSIRTSKSSDALFQENLTAYQQRLDRERGAGQNHNTHVQEQEFNQARKLIDAALSLGISVASHRVKDELTRPYNGMMPLERFMREQVCLVGERFGNGYAWNGLNIDGEELKKGGDNPLWKGSKI